MFRRVVAWIILAGFLLLIVNIMIFKILLELSIVIYAVIVVAFILLMLKRNQTRE